MPVLLVLITFSAMAADIPFPAFRIEVDGDGCRAFIKNVHSSPLSAYWLEQVGYPGTSWRAWHQSMGPDAMATGVERNFWFKNQTVCASPEYVKMLAAVYEDGTSAGDAEKIARIIDTRRQMLVNMREGIRRIRAAAAEGKSKQAIIDAITAWNESIGASTALRRRVEGGAGIQGIVMLLGKHSVEETIAELQKTERIFAASKPPLE